MQKAYFFVSIVILISSCTDRGRLERRGKTELRVLGILDRAFYKDDYALFEKKPYR